MDLFRFPYELILLITSFVNNDIGSAARVSKKWTRAAVEAAKDVEELDAIGMQFQWWSWLVPLFAKRSDVREFVQYEFETLTSYLREKGGVTFPYRSARQTFLAKLIQTTNLGPDFRWAKSMEFAVIKPCTEELVPFEGNQANIDQDCGFICTRYGDLMIIHSDRAQSYTVTPTLALSSKLVDFSRKDDGSIVFRFLIHRDGRKYLAYLQSFY